VGGYHKGEYSTANAVNRRQMGRNMAAVQEAQPARENDQKNSALSLTL
jgi:hypothetical protein